ncbi:MAG TPA: DNA helicase PcrA [Candidatus Anaerostipes avistercoris]|uniref:ATP-dependent DNA helicase n=1 Tax=Candidatus Anaerostipes avistercoris TaxID=2838462 RepID=A0A9D2TAK6_9FIRM|nr:DNA helicase PcrA [Candidatus Anaerostipes avistercoris]
MGIYDTLNEQQKEAVFCTEGPLLLLAGAGSGKTRVLTHRIAYLIDQGVNPYHIMAITFTNKAATEMRERVDQLVGYGAEHIWVSTFHSTCVRILRRHIDKLGFGNSFTIYDADDQKSLIRGICKQFKIDTKMLPERSIIREISSAKDEFMTPSEYEAKHQYDFNKKKIAEIYREYQKQLRSNNALDFDDLLFKTVELFQFHPEVLDYYQERFQYIMVDEYQDTNTIQFQLISMLARKYRNLCVVGDDDQSIYKFRGANIKNILNFENVFPDAQVIKLEQNYRSTQNILNAANEVIANNAGRKEKKLWTENEEGDLIEFHQYGTEYEEAEQIASEIEKLAGEGYEYKNMVILYRTNAQSRVFEERFMIKNIPYRIVGGTNFYQRKEVKDMICYLKAVGNGMDDLAVRRIINVPRRGIGAATIDKINTYAIENDISFLDACFQADSITTLGNAKKKIRGFADMIQEFRDQEKRGSLEDLFHFVLEKTGYVEGLKAEKTEEAESRIENINELLNKIVTYEQEAEEPSLGELLEEIALVADIDDLEDSDNRVILMTLHSAKGLEFPYVFICGMEDGIFPSYMTIISENDEDMEEERRLCYVGITRAKKKLYLSAAKRRMIQGRTQFNKVSRFVDEIPEELLDVSQNVHLKENKMEKDIFSTNRKKRFRKPYQAKSFAPPKIDKLSYGVGDQVSHIKFGKGIVTDVVSGGRDFEVTVDFEKCGVKKMFASFAKLKKVEGNQ